MKTATATRRNNLQILEEDLQRQLQEVGFQNLPLQISCSFVEETLMVVGEHPPSLTLKASPTLAAIQSAVVKLQPKAIQQVGICLKLLGQKHPYAFHSFSMEPSFLSRAAVSKSRVPTNSAIVPVSLRREEETIGLEGKESIATEDLDSSQEEFSDISASSNYPESIIIQAAEISESDGNPFDANDLEPVTKKSFRFSLVALIWVIGAGTVTALLLSFAYALTRPCVIGKCTAFADAQQLNQQSVNTLKAKKTINSVEEAQGKLNQAIANLEAIPFWSPRYSEAQKQLRNYRGQKKNLDSVIAAVEKGKSASIKSQNPPHSEENWIEIKSIWEEAIIPLTKIPKDSPVYPFSQNKLKEYKANLAAANKRLLTEEQGETKLNSAQNTARITEAREGVAQLPESWQKVESGWQTSVTMLGSIPKGTTAYEQAKVLLPKYETKLAKARDRKTIEEIAEDSYTQAVTAAAQARIFEQRKGWFQASEYWQNALTYAQEVPTTTSYYVKARPLITSYKASLQEVKAKLQVERVLLKARNDLDKVCNGSPKVCDFTISDKLIAVQMTPGYVQKLQQTFLKAGDKDVKTRQGVEKHLKTLQVALEAISDNAGVPMKLYDAEGKAIGIHGLVR